MKSVEAQVQAYQLQNNKIPTIDELVKEEYITSTTCPKGEVISISNDGKVIVSKS